MGVRWLEWDVRADMLKKGRKGILWSETFIWSECGGNVDFAAGRLY
jgi:hypothetical protein